MKRDMTLIRAILLWAIDQPHGAVTGNPVIDGHSEEEIGYHVHLMQQAGLVNAAGCQMIGDPSPRALLLDVTWDGHEFAEAARDESLWRKASGAVLREGGSFTFGLIKRWLEAQAAGALGL